MIAASTAGTMILLSSVPAAGAATSAKPRKVAVRQGVTAASLGGARIAAAAATTRLTVSFVLAMRNETALAAAVRGDKHSYLSVSQFANRYGQRQANISALESYLSGFGITSRAYTDGLDISTTGSAGAYTKALSAKISLYRIKAQRGSAGQGGHPAMIVHGTTNPATLPANLASFVYAILGLTSYPVASSNAVHTPLANRTVSPHATQIGNRTPASFASQYGLTSLSSKGFTGQGETVGIISYASINPADATHFWSKVLKISTKANRIKVDNIDGGSGPINSNSVETTLDVEQSGALAPQSSIIVYQAPNADYGAADAWFAAASQNVAAAVSTSWGQSEILNEAIGANGTEAATYGGIYDEAGLEMAAQGQSAFDATGDSGAYDDAYDATPYTELSVDNPADSPWITGAGGTTDPGKIPISSTVSVTVKSQRAWAWDYLWPYYATLSTDPSEGAMAADPTWTTGGGGGYSVVEPRPSYQKAIPGIGHYTAVPYLRPSDYVKFGTATACTPPGRSPLPCVPTRWMPWTKTKTAVVPPPATVTGIASGRAVPDLSADADPNSGYEIYFSGFAPSPTLETGWGGTSFVAPQFAGSAAVIDSFLKHRTGFWNLEIYKFATHSYTPFTPLSTPGASNDNEYYTGTTGTKYNPATGLGTVNLYHLALNFKYRS